MRSKLRRRRRSKLRNLLRPSWAPRRSLGRQSRPEHCNWRRKMSAAPSRYQGSRRSQVPASARASLALTTSTTSRLVAVRRVLALGVSPSQARYQARSPVLAGQVSLPRCRHNHTRGGKPSHCLGRRQKRAEKRRRKATKWCCKIRNKMVGMVFEEENKYIW